EALRVHGRRAGGRRGNGPSRDSSIRQRIAGRHLRPPRAGLLRRSAAEGPGEAGLARGDGPQGAGAGAVRVQLESGGGAGGGVADAGADPLIRGVYFYRYKNQMQPPRVSVVLPTLDRPEAIYNLLRHLEHQTLEPFEIVIVDQTAILDERVRAYSAERPRIRYHRI